MNDSNRSMPMIALPERTETGNYFVSNYPPYSAWSPQQVPEFERALQSPHNRGPLSLYVHVPFCRQRCMYCYFRVHSRRPAAEVERYVDALLAEASLYAQRPASVGRPVSNAYFGGGTPSLLTCAQIERLVAGLQALYPWRGASEVTFECQPGTVDREKLELLRASGVTRASIGMQSLSDEVLRGIGRNAGTKDCLEAYQLARRVGFDEVNIDLIAGLPGEEEATWNATLEKVAHLSPDSVTVYQLELTHNSVLLGALEKGLIQSLPSWSSKRQWVNTAFERLEKAGYTIYGAYWAVRDATRPRFAYVTEHYWKGHELLALGESAFGLLQDFHYQNVDTYEEYLNRCAEGALPLRRAYGMSSEERLRREFVLQLKTGCVDTQSLNRKFGIDLQRLLQVPLQRLFQEGFLTLAPESVRLTRKGLLVVDWLLPEFYLPHHQRIRYT
ncbi:MAG: coproporphyrinogen III oxidase family protein [Planctomycetes bacterium]|nr:coproporphyrinogen III oxidase family protein [Planctomycetota bacterium]